MGMGKILFSQRIALFIAAVALMGCSSKMRANVNSSDTIVPTVLTSNSLQMLMSASNTYSLTTTSGTSNALALSGGKPPFSVEVLNLTGSAGVTASFTGSQISVVATGNGTAQIKVTDTSGRNVFFNLTATPGATPAPSTSPTATPASTPTPFPGEISTVSSAFNTTLNNPYGLAVDTLGNIYVANMFGNQVTMQVAVSGTYFGSSFVAGSTHVIAGTGAAGYSASGTTATSALLHEPTGIAVDLAGNVYITDSYNFAVEEIVNASGTYFGTAMTAGKIYTVAGGNGRGSSGINGIATSAKLNYPEGVAVDIAGNLYIADSQNNVIDLVPNAAGTFFGRSMSSGNIYTVVGTGTAGGSANGTAANASNLSMPYGIALDSSGNLYIANTNNNTIVEVPKTTGTYFGISMAAGSYYTIAGNGTAGSSGDGALATWGEINTPIRLSIDGAGNVYVADFSNYRIRVIAAQTGTPFGYCWTANDIYTLVGTGTSGDSGDLGLSTSAQVAAVSGLAFDAVGNLYEAEQASNTVRVVYQGAGNPNSVLSNPFQIATDSCGNFYEADAASNQIKKFTSNWNFVTQFGSSYLNYPIGVAVSAAGVVYVANTNDHQVEMFDTNGNHTGSFGNYAGGYPEGIAINPINGKIAVAYTYGSQNILEFDPTSHAYVDTILSGQFSMPAQIVYDATGNLYVANHGTTSVLKVDTSNNLTTIATNGSIYVEAVAVDASGNVYMDAASGGYQIFKYNSSGTLLQTWGTGFAGTGLGQIDNPTYMSVINGYLYESEAGGQRIQKFNLNGTALISNVVNGN